MIIDRTKLLKELETVKGGFSIEETVEQSNCFVFQNGNVLTYNGDVACQTKCSLNITGAIKADKMLKMVREWPEKTINFQRSKGKLSYKRKIERGFFKTQDTVKLPVKNVDKPKKWLNLSDSLKKAINLVSSCAKRGSSNPSLSCIHFTPEWIEASDGRQAGRYSITTPFSNVLLNQKALTWIMGLDMTKFGQTNNWVHFRNDKGLIISCHKFFDKDEYPSEVLSEFIGIKGNPAILPKELKYISERQKLFLDESAEDQWLKVSISSNYLTVRGDGDWGSQSGRVKVKYKGNPIIFSVNPRIFREVLLKQHKCRISSKTINIKKGDFTFVAGLWIPEKKDK